MKKIMLSAAICALMFSANAENVETVEVSTQKDSFSGVYGGLGFGGNFTTGTKHATEMNNKVVDPDNVMGKALTKNRFMGSFVVGAGKQFHNNMYIGGEFLGDFSKTISYRETDTNSSVKVTSGGFVPHAIFKAGYVFKNDILAYGKLGFAWRKSSLEAKFGNNEIKSSKRKASFVLGAGMEKIFCKKFSAALEADYDFGYNFKETVDFSNNNQSTVDYQMKRIGKSWNIRALVKYNIKY